MYVNAYKDYSSLDSDENKFVARIAWKRQEINQEMEKYVL